MLHEVVTLGFQGAPWTSVLSSWDPVLQILGTLRSKIYRDGHQVVLLLCIRHVFYVGPESRWNFGFHRIVFVLFWFSRCFFSLRISDSASSHRSKSDFSMFENLDPTRPLSHLKGQQRCREAIHPGFQTTPRRTAGRFTNMFTLQVPPNMGYSLVKYHNFW